MKLEDEIKQSSFKSAHQKAHINLIYTSGWIQQQQAALFKPFGVTLPQFNVLRILRGQHPKPATISLLIERMLDKTSNASRIVDKLEVKGLVTRKQCPADRRTVDVLITDKGLALLSDMDSLEGGFGTGIKNLSEEEAEQLNILLDKIRD
ncbi:MarR family winged helix-turn-helix transcriptional regulator [Pontibacter locisalis]|uniref:MarR family winged helix-turn-helix transcriptional regulator n=1 Tax=Pontibacter locisalis TaxID=1719035 RepID=A0ABW5IN27_9BACT